MDHLKTEQERQDRWYSRKRHPRFVRVVPATNSQDFNDAHYRDDVVRSIPYERIGDPNLDILAILQQHGFLVVSSVLSVGECKDAMSLAWDWIKAATVVEQVQRESLKKLQTEKLYESLRKTPQLSILSSQYFPRSVEGGIFPFYGSGHSSFAWLVRSNPKVKSVFEAIFDTQDLISSLDGIVLWRPKEEHRTDAGWFHIDQNPSMKPDFESVQGLVNLLPVDSSVGGNVLVAQSNQLFPDHYLKEPFYKDRIVELKGDDWMEIPHDDDDVFQDETKILSCALGPGDLLLWDSRTVHCSYPAESDSNDHKVVVGDENLRSVANGLIRAATLVSMMPTDRATQSVLEQRREAVDSSRTLTHWANKVAPLGEEREELVAVESSCVAAMKKLPGPKVLLEFGDLSEAQRNLVVGNRYMTPSKD